ncbi:hypothetical protein B0A55_08634, partial [Friedmanniomyces simplex]
MPPSPGIPGQSAALADAPDVLAVSMLTLVVFAPASPQATTHSSKFSCFTNVENP